MINFGVESEYLEFKKSTSQINSALESISAMLNKNGKGKVIFGVNDNGDVVGQTIGNKTLRDLSHEITNRIVPSIVPKISSELCDDKIVIIVEFHGDNKPYSADGNYYIRSGSENKKILQDQLKELLFTSSADPIVFIESFNQDLSFSQLQQLYIVNGLSIKEDTFLRNLGLLCPNGKYNLMAELLADNNDVSIKVVRFSGVDKTNIVSRNEYGYKCLLLAMTQAKDAVEGLNETRVVVDGNSQRKEVNLFDIVSFREAWWNACLHTSWSKQISPAVYIFDDRIEIVSTGGLPVDFSKEDFYRGISHPINLRLQKIMGQLKFVEQTGHGVPAIINKYGREAFDISENHIIVTLKFPFSISKIQVENDNLSQSQNKVFQAIKNDPLITTSLLSKVCGLSTARISKIISELKSLGKISREGSRKNGYWKIEKTGKI